MHLNGTHNLPASPQQIWDLLMDAEVLAKITPGISSLEPLGNNRYTAVSKVKLGPVKGTFKGEMEVAHPIEPERFTLLMQQNSKIGNVNAEGQIILNAVSSAETAVEFSGEAKLSGTLARTGQRVLTGVANSMTNQFFQSLEAEIKERYPAASPAPNPVTTPAVPTASVSEAATTVTETAAPPLVEPVARTPQVVRETVQRNSDPEVGWWQGLLNWFSNLFK